MMDLWFAKIKHDVIARGIFTSSSGLRCNQMHYIRLHNKACQPIRCANVNPSHRIRTV